VLKVAKKNEVKEREVVISLSKQALYSMDGKKLITNLNTKRP